MREIKFDLEGLYLDLGFRFRLII